jgi:hypothetical protein
VWLRNENIGWYKRRWRFVGNAYDKYGSQNLMVWWIMKGFNDSLSEFVAEVAPGAIHEIVCAEGYWVMQ